MVIANPLSGNHDNTSSRGVLQSFSSAPRQVARGTRVPRVLLAEDDEEMRAVLRIRLRKRGYLVTECRDGLELLNHLGSFLIPADELPAEHEDFDVIVSDIRMPGATGLEILDGIGGSCKLPPIILITGFGDVQTHAEAIRLGAVAVFNKPFNLDDLLSKAEEITPTVTECTVAQTCIKGMETTYSQNRRN